MNSTLKDIANSLPKTPGVYIFKDKSGKVLYVGKSVNVRSRINSHLHATGEKTKKLLHASSDIKTISVESELEALLLEATLIKKHTPYFNSAAKDDKHPLYIEVTNEKYPKITTSRRTNHTRQFGPFPSSTTVKHILYLIRTVFPYCTQNKLGKKQCFYSHIGLCHPCPNTINQIVNNTDLKVKLTQEYKSNIRRILLLLSNNSKKLEKKLIAEMKTSVSSQNFEKAGEIRDTLRKLKYITTPYIKTTEYLQNPNLIEDLRYAESESLKQALNRYIPNLPKKINRIECFDVAHTGGTDTTCSLVTFINGEPDKNLYRRFKIKSIQKNDDYAALHEAISRRLKHIKDWGLPDLMVIDGGKGQVSTTINAIQSFVVSQGSESAPPRRWTTLATSEIVPVIGLAKRLEEIIIPLNGGKFHALRLGKRNPATQLLQRIRDEAHRFARSYHFKLRLKTLLN